MILVIKWFCERVCIGMREEYDWWYDEVVRNVVVWIKYCIVCSGIDVVISVSVWGNGGYVI